MSVSRLIVKLVCLSFLAPVDVSALELPLENLREQLTVHLKEVHGCEFLQFERDETASDDGWHFSIRSETRIEVVMQRRGNVVISLEASSADQGNEALEDMTCLLVATMRTLQPETITTYDAFYEAAFYWARSKFERFSTAFFNDTITTQYQPLMFRID